MLPKTQRLRKTRDFQRVFKNGRRFQGENFFIKVREAPESGGRVGIIVSKKVARGAVERNRIRRITSSALVSLLKTTKSSVDVVIVAQPGFRLANAHQAERELNSLFHRAQLI